MTLERYEIDPAHSHVGFSVRHMVIAKVRGQFKTVSGVIELDPDDLTGAKVQVRIDAASIDTGVEQRDAHLRSPDFFDTAQYPELLFESRRVEVRSGGRLAVTGDLTLHGVTREVTLDVVDEGRTKDPWGGRRAGFTARASIERKAFGLHWNQVLETGGLLVGDRVDIEIEVEAAAVAGARRAA